MQLVPRYLVQNRIEIAVNDAGFVTEYKPVYQRQIKIYRGIDNIVQFKLLNADQKPINTNLYTPKFVAFDENNVLVFEKDGEVLSDGSSNVKGLFQVTITENDLLNLKQQYISYNVYLLDSNNAKTLTYTDSHFDNRGNIFIDGTAFPGPQPTYSVSTFTETDLNSDIFVSETISAQPALNGNEALHTAAFYTSAYSGNIVVQATLDNQIGESTKWADIATVSFTGSETGPTPVNYNGVFSYVRFKCNADPAGKVSKILVRV